MNLSMLVLVAVLFGHGLDGAIVPDGIATPIEATAPVNATAPIEATTAINPATPIETITPIEATAPTTELRDTPHDGVLVVYYFHRTIRCEGCLQIERVARAAVTRSFRREIRMGRVVWRSVNLDAKGNELFERRYRLQVQTLVLSEQVRRREVRWRRLDDAWKLQVDPVALDAYVVREVREYLSAHTKEH